MFLQVTGCDAFLLPYGYQKPTQMSINTEDVASFVKFERKDEYKTGVLLKDGRSIAITEDFNSFAKKMS